MTDFPLTADEPNAETLAALQKEKYTVTAQLDENIVDRLAKKNSRQGLSEGTRRRYKFAILDFNQFLKANALSVGQESLMRYFEAVSKRLRPNTLNLHKTALLKCVKAQMGKNNILKTMAIEKAFEQIAVYKPDKRVSRDECFSEDTIKAIVEVAPTKKTGLIVQFLYKTGCRVGEMVNVRLADCEPINGYMRIRIVGKGKKERKTTIPFSLYQEIRRAYGGKTWLFESRTGKPLNPSNIGHQVRRAGEKVGLPNFYPHLLRHSRATDLLKHKGVTLTAVSQFLGHASVATTAQMYVHDEVDYHQLFRQDSI